MLAIIGGTGFYSWPLLEKAAEQQVDTPYGPAIYWLGEHKGKNFIFLPRHGQSHSKAPHLINYCANIYALKKAGVSKILAINTVGSLTKALSCTELLLVDDFIDFTYERRQTFYNGNDEGVCHIDMTESYDMALTQEIAACAHVADVEIKVGGVYVCTQGPRFETPAEVRMLALLGGSVVGMTGVPEVSLAKETGIAYAALCVITNMGAGLAEPLNTKEIELTMHECRDRILKVLAVVAERIC